MSEKDIPALEQSEDQKKITAFLQEYGELVKKHSIDFATYPQYQPSQAVPGTWETRISITPIKVDTTEKKDAPLLS